MGVFDVKSVTEDTNTFRTKKALSATRILDPDLKSISSDIKFIYCHLTQDLVWTFR